MPIIQRPYVPPEDQVPQEDSYVNPGDTQSADAQGGEPITFYCDSMHIFSSIYSAVLFCGEQMEEREPILRARIKVTSAYVLSSYDTTSSREWRWPTRRQRASFP